MFSLFLIKTIFKFKTESAFYGILQFVFALDEIIFIKHHGKLNLKDDF